jgi:UDP-3-O-[3-hydroxymyristoyl] N-acetylglucosamine deacetylase
LNNRLLRSLVADKAAWELISYDNAEQAPIAFVQPVPVT